MNRGYFADMKEFKEHGGKVNKMICIIHIILVANVSYIGN